MDSAAWDERYAAGRQWSATPNVFVAELCAALPPGRAIDLAAGEGRNALWLAGRGWEVTAVDFSAVALDRAAAQAATAGVPLAAEVADVLTWDPGPRPYDLALICYLQVSEVQRRRALATAAASLGPGGRLVVVAHDTANLESGTGGPRDLSVLWNPEETRQAMTDLGLRVELCEVRCRPVPGADRPALDTVAVAVRDPG
ncbi:MAG: class I SAM-dependent methyltransferase [Kineosporiaceae bacterium]